MMRVWIIQYNKYRYITLTNKGWTKLSVPIPKSYTNIPQLCTPSPPTLSTIPNYHLS